MSETKVLKQKTAKAEKVKIKKSNKLLYSIGAIVIGLLVGAALIILTGNSVSVYFSNLWSGSFGSLNNFGDFIGNLAWVIPIGLSMVVSFRAGVFNIGSAGQMLFSGFIAYLVAIAIGGSLGSAGIIVIALTAIIAGAFVAWLIAIMKTKLGVNEVISSIMLNLVIFQFVAWGYSEFDFIVDGANTVKQYDTSLSLNMDWLTEAFNGSTKVNIGIFVSLIVAAIVAFMYKKTNFGYKQDIVGKNIDVASYLGMNKDREYIKALVLSGALAGVAAWIFYFGTQHDFPKQIGQIDGAMYQGITVALIGFNTFGGSVLASIFISVFMNSGSMADSTVSSLPVTDLILAVIILLLALMQLFIIYRPQDNWGMEDDEAEDEEERIYQEEKAAKKAAKQLLKENKLANKPDKLKPKVEKAVSK